MNFMNKQVLERFKAHAKDKPTKLVAKKDEDLYDLFLYDVIGAEMFGGIGAKQFAEELSTIPENSTINIRINSPGGDVFEGVAIYSLLSQSKQKKIVCVDGLAASIASVIAMAGDKVKIMPEAEVMVHQAWVMAAGNAGELRALADRLEATDSNIRSIYSRKTGLEESKLVDLMAAETWMSASKAVELKFADEIVNLDKSAPEKKKKMKALSNIELMRLRAKL
jgi:ATP-dependent Clp protease protease subunit